MAFLTKSSDNKTQGNRTRPTGHSRQRLPLQAKLRLGQPRDAFEQEADKMADRVVNTPTNDTVQQQGKEEEESPVQTQPLASEISRYIQKQEMEEEPVQTQTEEEEPVQAQTEEEEEPVQAQMEEEEEPVQAQTEEEEPVQAQTEEEEEPVQAQTEEEEEPVQAQMEEEEEPVQAQSQAITNTDNVIDDPELEQLLASTKSGGEPLEPEILQEMEGKFNTSFAQVRIHRDSTAAELNRRFNAKAFTHGSHIYFNEGQYDPTGTEGKRLLAHELTHVLQQTGGVQREIIQRSNGNGGNGEQLTLPFGEQPNYQNGHKEGQPGSGTITFAQLKVPPFRAKLKEYQRPLKRSRNYKNTIPLGKTKQDWKTHIAPQIKDEVKLKLEQILRLHATGSQQANTNNTNNIVDSKQVYVFNAPPKRKRKFIGTLNEIAEEFSFPSWDKSGRRTGKVYAVDHFLELQAGGEDEVDNLQLLESEINKKSGKEIGKNIFNSALHFIDKVETPKRRKEGIKPVENKRAYAHWLLREYEFIFLTGVEDRNFRRVDETNDIWTQKQIIDKEHLAVPNFDKIIGVENMSGLGDKDQFLLFRSRTGFIGKPFTNQTQVANNERDWLKPWDIVGKEIENVGNETTLKALTIELKEQPYPKKHWMKFQPQPPQPEQINRFGGATFAGYIDKDKIKQKGLDWKISSPISLDSFDLDAERGIIAQGRVLPTIPIIRDVGLEFKLENGDITIFKQFNTGDIRVPSPFSITDSSLTLLASTQRGFGIEGQANFGIESVGEGFIGAAASTSGGFELEGEFNFDSQLFDPAKVGITYKNNVFGVTGEIGIPQGKVTGIKNASINVSYSEETLNAEGDAELDIKGVERGTLSINYSPEGWSIGGTFNLSNDIPGIRSGSISATVSKVTGEEGYQLTASGTAIPDIPGISSELSVEYDNGAITIQGRAAYNRGLLSGEINVGATNRALDETGQPTGDPTDTFIVYGRGSLTIQITPWLQGTVGIQFQPDGQMIVSGRIGLPSSIDVFDRIGIPERELFGIGFDIPIFAIPVGPKSIGLVASIRGGLKFHAGIGPGRLEGLELGVTYNPEHPEQTHVTGSGRFVVPAEAGLKLFVRATIGLSAVVGGVEGGLELAGGLGLEAEASAGINVDWTPETGLELRADLDAHVQPKFVFTIDGVIRAWITFYEEEWRWRLADYEYGPALLFGVKLLMIYRQGEPFNLSFDDLEVQYPNIDASSFIGGLIRDIRSSRS